ncbi:hypothetical protein E4K67_17315 [Desulfosporosinus fructosivorans]|uniref:Uncharacterized protein n=1 Tax=Desulfosporosinus fructosivorans TaxID=2018669 RepID=A0A4Z0R2Z2_9FIRM|nr:hypothetical protein [Desulfosporosinus fructosivorans]TGE36859.1 hypothetical protein E4K67_17315 [Desulfosporosinus fructosivorans]
MKNLIKEIRKQLLKSKYVKRVVACSLKRLEEERQAKHSAILMTAGRTLRKKVKPMNLEPHRTSATVTDDGVIVEYMDGRMIGQMPVTPFIVRPLGMGREKWT